MDLERITNIAEVSEAKKAIENLPEYFLENTKVKIELLGDDTLLLYPEEKRGVIKIKEGATNIRFCCPEEGEISFDFGDTII